MQLEHTFSVTAPIDDVWAALLDPETVAPCMPGATLTSVEGSTFTGKVKIKLGPVSMQYKGTGAYTNTDAEAYTVVIEASGKDAKGNGTAKATVTLVLTGEGSRTDGAASTELEVTGKPAQFGRGMISEVGDKILDQFAANLAAQLGTPQEADTPAQTASAGQPAAAASAGTASAGTASAGTASAGTETAGDPTKPGRTAEPQVSEATAPAAKAPSGTPAPAAAPPAGAEALDLTEYAGAAVAKRAAPLGAAGLLAALIVFLLLRRRSRNNSSDED